jgi:hypothetical protein
MWVWVVWLAAALLLCRGGIPARATGQEITLTEYDLKANWVFQFTKYVEWPAEAWGEARAPFVIGIVGKDPFGSSLAELVKGETAKGHPIQIRHFGAEDDVSACHLLFISRAESSRLKDILRSARGHSILTVGETEDFIKEGGMINLELADRKIRCDLNKLAANEARLRPKPQLRPVLRSVKE